MGADTTGPRPMVAPWLGFVRPLVLESADQIVVPGPYDPASDEYAADFEEVATMGAADSTARSAAQTETARFWSDNPVRQYQDALRFLAEQRDLDLVARARMFAVVGATAADALVACWRVKYEQPFWRPSTAIHRADEDGNPATTADPAWAPLLVDPPYPDYPSGHACLTGAVTEALEHLFGEDIGLEVASVPTGTTRTFSTPDQLDEDAMNGRIWLGIHFRKAMVDGNALGHDVARWALERHFRPVNGCG